MRIGFIGLGRMGANMVRRLVRDGHEIVIYNRTPEKTKEIAGEGATAAFSIAELVDSLEMPRAVWIMVPAGDATEAQIEELLEHLEAGDTIIDGGNTNFHDDQRRHLDLAAKGINYIDAGTSGGIWGLQVGYALMVGGEDEQVKPLEPVFTSLAPKGIHYVDVGTSGGVWGLQVGYCMMVGGPDEAVQRLAPILDVLAPPVDEESTAVLGERGWAHFGPPGAGHYVKMVHNGVEYGLMQAYAEGFDIFDKSDFDLDNAKIAHLWQQGSVVRSWLNSLAARAFEQHGNDLGDLSGFTEDSGEGRWTIEDAMEKDVPTPVITASLHARFYSRRDGDYTHRVLAALREQFGGHAIQKHAE